MFSISTMVQQDNFLTYIKNSKYAYYYPLFVFMLETALRVGEVCGLTWDDVDLEHGFVNITHQLQYNNVGKDACQYQILTPKSKSGVRNVPLSNAARDALMEQMKNQIKSGKFQNNAYILRICSSRSLVPHQSSPVNSKKSGSPTYGRLWLSNRFSLHRSHVIGNDVRSISVLYSSAKSTRATSLLSVYWAKQNSFTFFNT